MESLSVQHLIGIFEKYYENNFHKINKRPEYIINVLEDKSKK